MRHRKPTDIFPVLGPLASSMFSPGIDEMAESFNVARTGVIGCQTSFVIALGVGPLILAPLSETFGRRRIYLSCFTIFTLLQIPAALSWNLPFLITIRAFSGFFGSECHGSSLNLQTHNSIGVAIANGGGTISDMYEPSQRASILGIYLLGPLLGPTLGPVIGGVILQFLNWRWIFWVTLILCSGVLIPAFTVIRESYVPVLLKYRKAELERSVGGSYYYEGEDERTLILKVIDSFRRPMIILFTQPVVFTLALYQALIFGATYSLYTQFEKIYGPDGYGFSSLQLGLTYLGPGLGFITAVIVVVPQIGNLYNRLTKRHNGIAKPEYRLPLANIGAVLIPISIFSFAWLVEYHAPWFTTLLATFVFGFSQVVVFNSFQNYYIDTFEKYAASAIAAGALFRSLVGGVVPLFTPMLLDRYGYGWGFSTFAIASMVLSASPIVFYYYGERIRNRFAFDF